MAVPNGTYSASATVTYGVYGLIGGAWTRLGAQQAYLYGEYTTGGTKTLNTGSQISINYSGQIDGFRVVLESVDEGQTGTITGANATWTSQTTSGTRSATPSGEAINATVRPS